MIIIKTLTDDFIYDGELDLADDKWIFVEANKLYQSLTQVSPQGKVGFTFLRMDNGFLPMKDTITINKNNVIFFGTGDDKSEFGKIFREFVTSEAARKAGLVVPK